MAEKMTEVEAEEYLRGYCTTAELTNFGLDEVYATATKRADREYMATKVREAADVLGLS